MAIFWAFFKQIAINWGPIDPPILQPEMEGDVFFLGKVERQRCFAALRGVFRWNSRYSALITACGTAKHWQRAVALLSEAQLKPRLKVLLNRYGYGSIPINTDF